ALLFPYTTLFRSVVGLGVREARVAFLDDEGLAQPGLVWAQRLEVVPEVDPAPLPDRVLDVAVTRLLDHGGVVDPVPLAVLEPGRVDDRVELAVLRRLGDALEDERVVVAQDGLDPVGPLGAQRDEEHPQIRDSLPHPLPRMIP